MYHTFVGCTSFTGQGIGAWDTASVTKMSSMFLDCYVFEGIRRVGSLKRHEYVISFPQLRCRQLRPERLGYVGGEMG